jgi:CubicO group peptidase (beta-lactamase class C family)
MDAAMGFARHHRPFGIGLLGGPVPALAFILLLTSTPMARDRVLTLGQPEQVGMSAERLDRLDRVIQDAMEREEIPGAVALVARKGRVVYRKAFGDRSRLPVVEPMSQDSIFDVASLTKVMATTTSLMILVEEGQLSLTERVGEFVPEFARNDRDKERVTLLQLLTHYSGLRPSLDLIERWRGYGAAIDRASRERLSEAPGTRFIYSDINYILLAEVVRRVSGLTLDQFAQERIFGPLGMVDTGFNPDIEKVGRVAPTESRDGALLRGRVHDPTAFRMDGVAGHAGLFSTVDDTAVWVQMLLNGGIYGGVRVLSPLSVLKMSSPQNPDGSADGRGIGFDLETRFSTVRGDLFPVGSFGHTGFTGTSVWIDPFTETFLIIYSSRLHPEGKGNAVRLRSRAASVVGGAILDLTGARELFFRRF